jgi:hypothetical protein
MTAQIALRARDGSLKDWAIVDVDLFGDLSRWPWTLATNGYVVGMAGGTRQVYLHRYVMGCGLGDPGVDHRDGNPLNNCRSNLRIGTQALNMQNLHGARCTNRTSTHRGVSFDRTRRLWRAYATLNGRQHQVGRFATEDEAARAAAAFRREHMPFSSEAAAA